MTPADPGTSASVVVVGCGLISARWVRALSQDPRTRIAALVDPDPDAASRVAARCHLDAVPWFPELDSALAAVHADIAVNAAPARLHATLSAAALAGGLHVFSEKPLALRLDEACDLIAAARAADRVLAVMSNRGSDPRFLAVRDLVHAHSAGPYAIHAEMFVRLPSPGFRADVPFPATADLAVHAFDQVRQFVAAPPLRMRCDETPLAFLGPHCTTTTLTVEFADTSVLAFRGGFTTTAPRTSADGVWRIEAPGAGLMWEGGDTATLLHRSTEPRAFRLPASGGHQAQITAMVDAVHGAAVLPEPLGSIALLEAALRAAKTGLPVDLAGRWYP